jgi:hypothetical protein
LKVKDVKMSGRATRGVRLMRLRKGDFVASVARISADNLKQAGADVDLDISLNGKDNGQQKLL